MPVLASIDSRLTKSWTILGQDHTPHSLTGLAGGNHLIATFASVPGGSMGPNGELRITSLWSMTNNANSKSARIYFGGTAALTGTAFYGDSFTVHASEQLITMIRNRNSQSSQVGQSGAAAGFGQGNRVVQIAAIDTAVDQSIFFSGTLANAADVITLESYLVEVLYGA